MSALSSLLPPLVFGLLAAALVNYLSDVLPRSRRPARPHCLHCDFSLPWPYYLGNRPCPQCGQRPWRRRHAVTWVLLTALYLWLWQTPSPDVMPWPTAVGWGRAINFVLLVIFGLIFVIDLEHRVVLDQVSLAGGLVFALLGAWLHNWPTTLLGGLGGFLLMYGLYGLGELYLRWKIRRGAPLPEDEVALGFGDVKLAAILGLLLGWPDVLVMLLLALLLGGLFGLLILIVLLARRQDAAAAAMPYAPYLIVVTAYILLL